MATTKAPKAPKPAKPPVSSVFGYRDVQAILRGAGGTGTGPLGAFWDLPLPQFLGLNLMGVALIEPETGGSCCGKGSDTSGRGRSPG